MDKNRVLNKLINYSNIILNSCWLYKGAVDYYGYGVISINNKTYRVHRLSAWIHHDLDLDNPKEVARHKHNICPNRYCWNPDHISKGSQADNIEDQIKAETHRSFRYKKQTHCLRGHLLPKNRICKECNNIRSKKFYDNKRKK